MVYIFLLLMILLKPEFNMSNPSNIIPIYINRIMYFLKLDNKIYKAKLIIIINKEIYSILIAVINVVIQVPKLAPIIIPKQSFGFINLDDNKDIAIAVVPDEDWISAAHKNPNRKLLNFVFTDFVINCFNLDAKRLLKAYFI